MGHKGKCQQKYLKDKGSASGEWEIEEHFS